MSFMDTVMTRVRAMDRFIPDEGFNVVGVDSFEEDGDELYLIGHYLTREAAEAAKADHEKTSDDVVHIYVPRKKEG
jgi:hypothetical protein